MSDPYTQMLALMLGIEVKAQYGNEVEARAQLAVWLAAGLKHRRDVATAATGNAAAMDEVPMLGWTVIGHQWDLYMAFVESGSTGDVVSSTHLLLAHVRITHAIECTDHPWTDLFCDYALAPWGLSTLGSVTRDQGIWT